MTEAETCIPATSSHTSWERIRISLGLSEWKYVSNMFALIICYSIIPQNHVMICGADPNISSIHHLCLILLILSSQLSSYPSSELSSSPPRWATNFPACWNESDWHRDPGLPRRTTAWNTKSLSPLSSLAWNIGHHHIPSPSTCTLYLQHSRLPPSCTFAILPDGFWLVKFLPDPGIWLVAFACKLVASRKREIKGTKNSAMMSSSCWHWERILLDARVICASTGAVCVCGGGGQGLYLQGPALLYRNWPTPCMCDDEDKWRHINHDTLTFDAELFVDEDKMNFVGDRSDPGRQSVAAGLFQ